VSPLEMIIGGMFVFVIAPLTVYLIVAHGYARDRAFKMREEISAADAERFKQTITRLETRMKSLEAILDSEAPDWRRKVND
jgi:hypothetical protein